MANNLAPESSQVIRKLSFHDSELIGQLCRGQNAHLHILEKRIGLSVNVRGNDLLLRGREWEIELAEKVLNQLYGLLKNNYPIYSKCKRFYAVCGVDLCDSCIKDLEYKRKKFMEEHDVG